MKHVSFILSFFLIQSFCSAQTLDFTELASSLGIADGYGIEGPFAGSLKPGGGLSFSDFNQDGWDDLTVSTQSGEFIHFYQNNAGSSFTKLSPLVTTTCESKQLLWIDFDNDGDKDFFVTCAGGQNEIYENTGNLNLVSRTLSSGIELNQSVTTMTVSVGDIDNDSYLDLITGKYESSSSNQYEKLYLNNGDFTFTDISSTSGIEQTGSATLSISFEDINHDLRPDICISNDKVFENKMYTNLGNSTFNDISVTSNTNIKVDAMNSSTADVDRDGDLDLFISNNPGGNVLFRNNGDETFTDISTIAGVAINKNCWAANFLDVENDGDLDLYICNAFTSDKTNPLLINNGAGIFTEPLAATGGIEGDDKDKSYCNVRGDFNNDGLEDLVVSNLDVAQIKVWKNDNQNPNHHWIKLNLDGTASNKDGVGAWVTAHKGANVYTRYSNAGNGYLGQNSDYVLIGLGIHTQIDSLVIEWPSGIVDPLINPVLDQTLTVVEGSSPNSYQQAIGPFLAQITDPNVSVARNWMELLLASIRKDYARPTVHARNLFHSSVVMFDAWAAYQTISTPYFLGQTVDGYTVPYSGVPAPADVELAREKAISFAMYRLLHHRFANSPGYGSMAVQYDQYMSSLGYNTNNTSLAYSNGDPGALGNYLAQEMINFGLQDGGNEQADYANLSYEPINDSLVMNNPGNPNLDDFNRWQPLSLDVYVDQSGNTIPSNTPDFLSPEWGQVSNFALPEYHKTTNTRNGFAYDLYHDPGPPMYLDTLNNAGTSPFYKWGFSLVSIWSSHLSSNDATLWDISPASIGNIQSYPNDPADYSTFYDFINGGDSSPGHAQNPITQMPYTPQLVKRGDYARVLAEFWADGPDSETPPGHWFTLLNHVSDHPQFQKKYKGTGSTLSDLEWDVKAYLCLGGPMHDAAIAAWGAKGWYDYIRPVSAIRGMARLGQSTDVNLPSYHIGGLPLVPGFIELVQLGDPLAGPSNKHLNKVKLYAWKGPDYIADPENQEAGVDWILAENWWPYQRPSFVTPPFAGYVSGHSTFSRTAAEILTQLTGDPFFPGGLGQFSTTKNEFLVFEEGPSEDIILQWATYRDASDQCSLSRIWGGIHPPIDDIPGRLMGQKIGIDGFQLADYHITGNCNNLNHFITDNPIDIPVYYGNVIEVNGKANGIDVTLNGEQYVEMLTGMEVLSGTTFLARINPCN